MIILNDERYYLQVCFLRNYRKMAESDSPSSTPSPPENYDNIQPPYTRIFSRKQESKARFRAKTLRKARVSVYNSVPLVDAIVDAHLKRKSDVEKHYKSLPVIHEAIRKAVTEQHPVEQWPPIGDFKDHNLPLSDSMSSLVSLTGGYRELVEQPSESETLVDDVPALIWTQWIASDESAMVVRSAFLPLDAFKLRRRLFAVDIRKDRQSASCARRQRSARLFVPHATMRHHFPPSCAQIRERAGARNRCDRAHRQVRRHRV